MVMFDPIQNSGPERAQDLHILGEKCQTDWQHPESCDGQESKNPAEGQRYPSWDSNPASGWLLDKANG
jgi:hypothetical protein